MRVSREALGEAGLLKKYLPGSEVVGERDASSEERQTSSRRGLPKRRSGKRKEGVKRRVQMMGKGSLPVLLRIV